MDKQLWDKINSMLDHIYQAAAYALPDCYDFMELVRGENGQYGILTAVNTDPYWIGNAVSFDDVLKAAMAIISEDLNQ